MRQQLVSCECGVRAGGVMMSLFFDRQREGLHEASLYPLASRASANSITMREHCNKARSLGFGVNVWLTC